jgi:hypothetical protein
MKAGWMMAVALAGVGAVILTTTPRATGDTFGLKGKMEVSRLELAYVPGSKAIKVRLRFPSAAGVDYETADAETIERLLRFADMKVHGGRLAVEMEGSAVKAFYVAVGGAPLGKDE